MEFNLRETPVQRVMLCGDWHANYGWATKMITHAHATGMDAILQVGDFGFDLGVDRHLTEVSRFAVNLSIPVLFIDGNHENFDTLNKIPVREDGLREVEDGVYHIPRGTTWEWQGKKWLAAGGAHSVDKQWRVPGISWWPEETITDEQLDQILAVGKVDVLVSHDTGLHKIPGVDDSPFPFPIEELHLSYDHRRKMQRILDATSPELNVHGHYHTRYTEYFYNKRVIGLDKDNSHILKHILHVGVVDNNIEVW